MTFVAALVAHQGGWDEVLLVAAPIVVIIGALAVAKKRVDADLGSDRKSADRALRNPDS